MKKPDIKVIIAGTRTFNDYRLLKTEVNMLIMPGVFERNIEIVSGCAEGADKLGERYAEESGFSVKRFPADWNKHGKKAAYIRNNKMAIYSTHCICFWDGKSKGTKMMINIAKNSGLNTSVILF